MKQYDSPVADSPGDDLQMLHDLTLVWVETAWRHGEVEPFNFKQRLKEFYDCSSVDTQFFDGFDVEQRINYSADDCASIGDLVVPKLRRLTNKMIDKPNIIISDTLSSLVWRRS
jgi:hypothetical protein